MTAISEYFTQKFARQCRNMIIPIPDGLVIPERHLRGIANDEFIAAFHTYQEILRQIYCDVENNPVTFGMLCLTDDRAKRGVHYGPVTNNEAKSRKSFFRLPNILLALASTGILTTDGGLFVDIAAFLSFKNKLTTAKITTAEPILQALRNYGFEFEGLPESTKLKNIANFTIYYPNAPNLLVVLKAFSCVRYYEDMLSADYRHLLAVDGFNMQYDINDILRIVDQPSKAALKAIDKTINIVGEQNKLNIRVNCGGIWMSGGSAKYYLGRVKKEYVSVSVGRDHSIIITLRLVHIAGYAERLSELSHHVREQILNAFNCRPCYGKYCGKGYEFKYEGKKYLKCHMIYDNFHFVDFANEDIPSLVKLLEWELNAYTKSVI